MGDGNLRKFGKWDQMVASSIGAAGTFTAVADRARAEAIRAEQEGVADRLASYERGHARYEALGEQLAQVGGRSMLIGGSIGAAVGAGVVGASLLLARSGGTARNVAWLASPFVLVAGVAAGALVASSNDEDDDRIRRERAALVPGLTGDARYIRDHVDTPLSEHLPPASLWRSAAMDGQPVGLDAIVERTFELYDHDADDVIALHGTAGSPADELHRHPAGGPVESHRERRVGLHGELLGFSHVKLPDMDVDGSGSLTRSEVAQGFTDNELWGAHLARDTAPRRNHSLTWELEPNYLSVDMHSSDAR